MGSSDKGGPPLTRAEWLKIFNLVNAHKELEEVKKALRPRNRITITRAYNAARELIKMGNTPLDEVKIQQIKKTGYGATERSIDHADSMYRDWLRQNAQSVVKDDINGASPKYIEENDLHLKKLNTLASRIRSSIANPDTESREYPSYKSLWMYGGQDWRLTPKAWGQVMLPYLEDEKVWNRPISIHYLFEHIKNSPFQKHYSELLEEIGKLQQEFFDTAEIIKTINPQIFADWNDLNDDLEVYGIDLKPLHNVIPPEEIEALEFDPQYYNELLRAFRENITSLDKKYDILEDFVQQLYDDLDEDIIQDIIKKGSCEKCRTSTKAEQISDHDGTSGLIDALQKKTKGNPSVDVRLDL